MKLEDSNYINNRKWSDQFIPEIKRILGEIFITESSEFKDRNEATDLIVLELEKKCFACRVRRHWVYREKKYRHQFTIRHKLPEYKKSELEKIKEGFGDIYFYGFSNNEDNGSGFEKYIIFDLNIFREHLPYLRGRKDNCWGRKQNKDNSPDLWWFNMNCFPANMYKEIYDKNENNQKELFE